MILIMFLNQITSNLQHLGVPKAKSSATVTVSELPKPLPGGRSTAPIWAYYIAEIFRDQIGNLTVATKTTLRSGSCATAGNSFVHQTTRLHFKNDLD